MVGGNRGGRGITPATIRSPRRTGSARRAHAVANLTGDADDPVRRGRFVGVITTTISNPVARELRLHNQTNR